MEGGHIIWGGVRGLPFNRTPGPENATIYPIPGDVGYFYFPVGHRVPRDAWETQNMHGAVEGNKGESSTVK